MSAQLFCGVYFAKHHFLSNNVSACFLAALALKKVPDAAPAYAYSNYLINKATGFLNTKIKCRLRDTYSYLLGLCPLTFH
ncbi:hypothetical protein BZG74_10840 [Salinivibrio sharmensis]|uniref:Uncharacterized protein n=1 Tax=Salinivibrio sharmensis TaxID=390883 RepID=A0ABX3KFD3_9GAMM|nr:hypothetical protein BZG74_10840 [Salinivibrio sharmensis]